MEYVISLIIVAFEGVSCLFFFGAWLKPKPIKRQPLWAFLTFIVLVFPVSNTIKSSFLIKMGILAALCLLWSLLFWRAKFWTRLIIVTAYYSLVNATDYTVVGLLWRVTGVRYPALVASPFYFVLTVFLSKPLLVALSYYMYRVSAKSNDAERGWKGWLALSWPAAGLLAFTIFISGYLQQNGAIGNQLLMVTLLFTGTTILYFVQIAHTDAVLQREKIVQKNEQELARQNREQRTALHDTAAFSRTIQRLLEQGQQQRALEMVRQLVEHCNRVPQHIHTENAVVDAVLNDQCAQAQEQGTQLYVEVCSLKNLAMQALDIAMLFSNLLNNARKACMSHAGERRISIQIVPLGEDRVRLTVRNTCSNSVPASAVKEDTARVPAHGYGKEIIARTLQTYGCEYITEQTDGWYKFLTVLPCPQGQGPDTAPPATLEKAASK